MLVYSNLENISTDALLHTFNASFSDYLVKMQLTKEQLERKLIADSIDLKLSAGAYENGKLVGFILHGINKVCNEKIAYNAGTGVIPAKRGHNLTGKMYRYILPFLEKEGVTKCILEVLEKNLPALKTYKAIGYQLKRELVCFKGIPKITGIKGKRIDIHEIKHIDWQEVTSFWDWTPSWQNSIIAMQNLGEHNKIVGIYLKDKLVAYISYNPLNNRIAQFAVHKSHRRKGYGKALFKYVFNVHKAEISVINIDIDSSSTITFLGSIGLFPYIYQYEMEKNLRSDVLL
ncbi:GNAT superfamily N-acetyltransferase [Pedobacter sp. AK017]|uniref:GNAT family N-acetyltransferase n=1 Tax=Pedobacter sp. AK017 TaxID=2723073 RepID=UPI00160FF968|nr:GNAT family N-acetyltransferase [Pedobacter sp. AK017]MBB5439228.1 GNAT superfamily N-acetyltransferase [Pedobacter sp. AK017]